MTRPRFDYRSTLFLLIFVPILLVPQGTVRGQGLFVRSDVDLDTVVGLGDVTTLLAHLFQGDALDCLDAADVNDDGALNLLDPIHSLQLLFGTLVAVPAPYPYCGTDPTSDGLNCTGPSSCPSTPSRFAVQRWKTLDDDPSYLTSGDLNGDGHPDLIVSTGEGLVEVLPGLGDGTFAPAVGYPVGVGAGSIDLADMNLDGYTDVVVVNPHSDEVHVLPGIGDGTFEASISTFVGADFPEKAVVVDLNDDGILDIVTLNTYPESISILLGVGDGTFVLGSFLDQIDYIVSLVVDDINGDGVPDIISRFGTNSVKILGNGDGTFAIPQALSVPGFPQYQALEDLNGDGFLDLLVTTTLPDRFVVLSGNGAGQFTETWAFDLDFRPWQVVIGDLDGDGDGDALVRAVPTDEVLTFAGNGDGTFTAADQISLGSFALNLTLSDYDSDGDLDVGFACPSTDDVGVLLSNGDGTFFGATRLDETYPPETLAVADFDGDTVPDLVSVGRDSPWVTLRPGNGDGTFGVAGFFSAGIEPSYSVATDLNLDGAIDLVFASYQDDVVRAYLNDGLGNFTLSGARVAFNPSGLAVGDFNEDGVPDLVVSPHGVSFGNGTGQLSAFIPGGIGGSHAAVGDFDADGFLDLVEVDDSTDTFAYTRGASGASFFVPVSLGVAEDPTEIAVGDVNEDGLLDVAVSFGDGMGVRIFLNDGAGGFEAGAWLSTEDEAWGVRVHDVDGDGHQDVVARIINAGLQVWRGVGNGTFVATTRHSNLVVSDFAFEDLDGDGRDDIATANFNSSFLHVIPASDTP